MTDPTNQAATNRQQAEKIVDDLFNAPDTIFGHHINTRFVRFDYFFGDTYNNASDAFHRWLSARITSALDQASKPPPGHVRDENGNEYRCTIESGRTDHEADGDLVQLWCVLVRKVPAQAAKGARDE